MMSETNQKALAEMDDACRKLAEANILFAEMASKLLASHHSLREANATSVNRNAPCYVAIQEQLDLGYLKLVEAAEQVSEAFDHPLLIKMVVAGEKIIAAANNDSEHR